MIIYKYTSVKFSWLRLFPQKKIKKQKITNTYKRVFTMFMVLKNHDPLLKLNVF